ncbi:hypothetical protein [Blastococcus xanthinilyticus]|uniref:Uncharacterized protein n=1 Tax=Blastococcus xanthinilyticus TaxID=1564164 RepID=A0A5S5CTW5_9ACTN|nr:hypothetical protein [Blastococcus xanthinilyticus]TYP87200.1 hypothetical protein BD833_107140 [Blastococcus xanthinilyticus]
MPCPSCGATDARTQILPGYWRCDAVVRASSLVADPVGVGAAMPISAAPEVPARCGTVYIQTRDENGPALCRCGDPAIGECTECTRMVCADHSALWQGWRVCDRDLANARLRARTAALAEEKRRAEEAAAAEAERHRQRTTLLELADEDAVWLLYVRTEPRTEQEIRSAVHVLRGLNPAQFTDACLYLLPYAGGPETRRTGLTRLSGWAFEGPDFHGRSWFLTRKGEWHRSGTYGTSGGEAQRWKKVRFDDVEKRAVIDELSWQQTVTSGLL